MNLLILTQKVDKNDPILGFFHRWIQEFSNHCDQITVICLEKGEYDFSDKVSVLSLGKEEGKSRLKYLWRFYKYIWQFRINYDSVFVHMNQEYVILGWIFWKLWRKKIHLWRNHPGGSAMTDLAVSMSSKVFCTSSFSYTARFPKTEIMPVGVDTHIFRPQDNVVREPGSLLFFGRLSKIKRPELFILACRSIKDAGQKFFKASIVGDPPKDDQGYFQQLIKLAIDNNVGDVLEFKRSISNSEAPRLYSETLIYINATPSGSFDKTILEAMACGCLILTCNESLRGFIDERFMFKEDDAKDLANKARGLLSLSSETEQNLSVELRRYVVTHHDLRVLAQKLFSIL